MPQSFRTELNISPSKQQIGLQSPVLLAGSCFAERIGSILSDHKFSVLSNPFGTIYNPLSLFSLLEKALKGQNLIQENQVRRDGVFYNYELHSDFGHTNESELGRKIDQAFGQVQTMAESWSKNGAKGFLILTLGTAWVYRRKDTGETVANCHKTPASLFEKVLLKTEEMLLAFLNLYAMLPADLHIILTVSPVRHLKDTLPLNSLSKAVLRLLCHQLCEEKTNISYFPAFELLTDDLRDYRFYDADMIHPNNQAIDYIFDRFAQAYLRPEAMMFMEKWKKIRLGMAHRPFQAETAAYRDFLLQLIRQIEEIKEVDTSQELDGLRSKLSLLAFA
jgi:GSCFA family